MKLIQENKLFQTVSNIGRFLFVFGMIFILIFVLSNLPAVIELQKPIAEEKILDLEKNPTQKEIELEVQKVQLEANYLYIPALEIKSPVVWESDPDEILKDLKNGVVRYPESAHPGEQGNLFIVGHSSSYWWDSGRFKTVFARLSRIEKNQEIWLNFKEQIYIYKVVDLQIVSPGDTRVLQGIQGKFLLTLMTCYPTGTTQKRLIVTAEQYYPLPTKSLEKEEYPRVETFPQVR